MIQSLAMAALAFALPALTAAEAPTATPATTVSPAAVTSAARPAKKVRDPNELICRTIPEPGSRLGGTKTCMTRADWDQQARDSKDAMGSFQANHTSTGMGSK